MKLNFRWFLFFILIVFSVGDYYMYAQSNKMAVFVIPESENDHEWPSRKKWIDASKWLETSQYIKIDDFYLLNLNYTPIDDLNVFGITARIQEAIKNSGDDIPELAALNNLDSQVFFQLMDGKLSSEYLRTEFNNESLTPIDDYFLIFFLYKGNKYEVELLRTIFDGKPIFMTYGSAVRKSGYWHSILPAGYSYKDFKEGKPVK
ncbi:hypothetical protein [Serratia rubidaea]|uniref:hypothetical protein n=1 Tax=Serratia rubidaea TaxID=61652 RepID=UPI001F2CD8A2|nr:hypothetical protein [Serratia rubidaea]